MEYRELGRTGLRVSEIGLGCEGFVGKTEEETQALMPLRYNKDKRKKPVFSRVSAFVAVTSIPFPTLKLTRKSENEGGCKGKNKLNMCGHAMAATA